MSEGRDPGLIAALAAAAGPGLLDVDAGWDAHRTVLTLAGDLVEANLRIARVAVQHIDLTRHSGIHVRMGAVDVIPLVPNDGDVEGCLAMADTLSRRLADELGLPVWRYGIGARDLRGVRRGGFEELAATMAEIPPDFGPRVPHPTAGAVAVGVRDVLIALNVCLDTSDVAVARRAARAVRSSSGGLPGVLAIGWYTPTFGCAQVSMNLVDWRVTPPHAAMEAVARIAPVTGCELVGMIPLGALEAAAEHWGTDVEGAVARLGLGRAKPFSLAAKVLPGPAGSGSPGAGRTA